MKKHLRGRTQYLNSPLNRSKSKSTHSFSKSPRFQPQKNFSPNKYYNLPGGLSRRAPSIGFGKKVRFERTDTVSPNAYKIVSPFDVKNQKCRLSFGISRSQYYKGKGQQKQNPVGPGAYDVIFKDHKNFYIGRKVNESLNHHNASCTSYTNNGQSLNLLSQFPNNKRSFRMKTDYFQKDSLHEYDNKVPGPGSYSQLTSQISRRRKHSTTFGNDEKLKLRKESSNIGPAGFYPFSQFGNNLF